MTEVEPRTWPRVLPLAGVGGPMMRRLTAIVLSGHAFVVLFGGMTARGLLRENLYLWIGLGLAVLCVAAAGTMRRPFGITLGWIVQIGTLLMAFAVPAMLVVGLIFLALWLTALVQGRKMDALTARYLATHPARQE